MPNGNNGPVATDKVTFNKPVLDDEGAPTYDDDGNAITEEVIVCNPGDHAPNWYNNFTQGAGIYWWGSAEGACESWAGYRAMVDDEDQCIFYANVPKKVVAFVWNNGIDGGMAPTPGVDPADDIYYKAAQTSDVASEYPDPGEYATMPEGASSFDNCIFIVDPMKVDVNAVSNKMTCGGTWYFYYGDGCYGMYGEESDNFKSVEENCCNPDHYENGDITGKHIGGGSSVVRGDYDGDGEVLILDATRAQRIIAELTERPDEAFLKAVDADGDGELNILDATRIQRVVAELCDIDGNPIVA